MCFAERYTVSRGWVDLAIDERTRERRARQRRVFSLRSFDFISNYAPAVAPALPTLRRTCSFS
jgi:hypothetical protein